MTISSISRTPPRLDDAALARGVRFLSRRDPELRDIAKRLGPPPIWARDEGFPTLVHIMLEQQVSLASAKAAFDRLVASTSQLTPSNFLRLDDDSLRRVGFSRQKTLYVRELANRVLKRELDLDALNHMDDETARAQLMKVKGIGTWTSDIYLLMALRRRDTWPTGDLALAIALKEVKQLRERPTPLELEELSQPWRPWRAVAARLLWLHYLDKRGRITSTNGDGISGRKKARNL